jgi:hypothetical protein
MGFWGFVQNLSQTRYALTELQRTTYIPLLAGQNSLLSAIFGSMFEILHSP